MLALAVAIELGLACSFYQVLHLGRGARRVALAMLGPAILLAPQLIPPDRRFARLLAAILAVAEAGKLFDLLLGADRGDRPRFRSTFAFLINPASMVRRKLDLEPRPTRREDWRRLASMSLATVPGVVLFLVCYLLDWRAVPFAVEHSAKALLLFAIIVPGGSAGAALWRLLGGQARDPMNNPFAASTPADFWRRWNRPAQQFFLEDVYKPLGGPRQPIRATLATFLVSGLLHEYLFDIAASRVQGYQIAYFLIQGVGVMATMRGRRRGLSKFPTIAATLAFNLATGILFFASLDEVVAFYARR